MNQLMPTQAGSAVPACFLSPVAVALTPAQKAAREAFDLDEFLASLPPLPLTEEPKKGSKGQRLRPHLVADISEDLLREFAKETLGASRCNAEYLRALRVVLGNQADAERKGYALELNRRADFASERTMRTIIEQMACAGITKGVKTWLGDGRAQVVQCFDARPTQKRSAAGDLEAVLRAEEEEAFRRSGGPVVDETPCPVLPEEVPY